MAGSDKLLEALSQEIGALEQRLTPILRGPGVPTGNQPSGADRARAEPSALASTLESRNARISGAIDYVRSLNARVDL